MLTLIDSHAHLDFPQFDADREAVIGRAREAGVMQVVNPGVYIIYYYKFPFIVRKYFFNLILIFNISSIDYRNFK